MERNAGAAELVQVVSRNGADRDALHRELFAGRDDLHLSAQLRRRGRGGDDHRLRLADLRDIGRRGMVRVLVGDEHEIGLRSLLQTVGVDVDHGPLAVYPEAVVPQPVDLRRQFLHLLLPPP